MTAKELIEKLSLLDPEQEVRVVDIASGGSFGTVGVTYDLRSQEAVIRFDTEE